MPNSLKFLIPGPIPTVNHCYTTVALAKGKLKRFKSASYEKFTQSTIKLFKEAFPDAVYPIFDITDTRLYPIHVRCVLYFKSPHIHDVDNYAKAIFDSLNGLMWSDDCHIGEMNFSKTSCKKKKEERAELQVCIGIVPSFN